MAEPVLEVRGLTKHFPVRRGVLVSRVVGWVRAVDGVSFAVHRGETFGLVGESGCGKTTTARLILLLEKATAGTVLVSGQDLARLAGRATSSATAPPSRPYSRILTAPSTRASACGRSSASRSSPTARSPGGPSRDGWRSSSPRWDRPRRAPISTPTSSAAASGSASPIARALALNPRLVVLDEPVSALDVSIRAQIMNLLKDLQARLGLTYLLIAHDLATVRYLATTVGVMYLGRLVETAAVEALFSHPCHPYTQALLSAALPSHPDVQREEVILPGEVPSPLRVPAGCRFHPRCPVAMPVCAEVDPAPREVGPGHSVACHLY